MAGKRQQPAAEPITRVEFSMSSAEYPFVGASAIEGCRISLEEIIPRGSESYAEFFAVDGADPDRILDLAREHESAEPTLLETYDSGGLFEFDVSSDCPAVFLSERGALPRRVYGEGGEGYLSAEIPAGEDAGEIVGEFLDAHPDATLESKATQPHVTPMFNQRQLRREIETRLTDRQQEVLTAAHESGYYEWPRETTAEELAEQHDISASALLKHLRAVERKFIAAFFEAPSG
ncbi:HTH DNA binding domain-containing protein [Natronoarchaeum philippinense]|uniref:HTH DNA binding domain-containing protein n=1 Tax=Natronoarchaeum philippinense TaxID=558529 RepID=A0A285NUX8_NATPI|nr:bacterio-opsin activator domain-containing protein [Natronoarchaeum philippinense]SNZ13304.1 HTH DNA binding domain-containing protein [Natronoarchaeum philippinense]